VKLFPPGDVNLMLEAMKPDDRDALLDLSEAVDFERGDFLFRVNGEVPWIYFPTSGMLSVVIRMKEGATVEAVTIGKEGLTGPPIIAVEGVVGNVDCVCQLPGSALRVPTERLFELRRSSPPLDDLLNRYAQVVFGQLAQTAACNRLHSIEARTSRWLLLSQDRVAADVVHLTQEFLAEMLGVRRETVNLSARMLQNAGLIEYHRGEIRILDRDGLESTACECYEVIRGEFERLFAPA
jgi:CRP-like cAMP-binding protein